MEIANKFLRSVEKERQKEALASDSSTSNDLSNLSRLMKETQLCEEESSLASTIESHELNTPVMDVPENNASNNESLNLAHDILDNMPLNTGKNIFF
jgi:hypothetical protein